MNINHKKSYVAVPVNKVFTNAAWAKDPAFDHLSVILPRSAALKENEIRKMRRNNLKRVIELAAEELRSELLRTRNERCRAALNKRLTRLEKLDVEKIPLPQSFLLSYTDIRRTLLARRNDTRELLHTEISHEHIRLPLRIFRLGYPLGKTLSIVKGNVLEILEEEIGE